MAEASSFQIQFEIRLVPADSEVAEVTGYASAGQVVVAGQPFGVFVGNFTSVGGASHGIAQAGIAQFGIAQAGIRQAGIAQSGIAQSGIAQSGIARQ